MMHFLRVADEDGKQVLLMHTNREELRQLASELSKIGWYIHPEYLKQLERSERWKLQGPIAIHQNLPITDIPKIGVSGKPIEVQRGRHTKKEYPYYRLTKKFKLRKS